MYADPTGVGQAKFSSSATPIHELGARFSGPGGRTYRYVKAGAADLVVGDLIQSPAIVANHQNCAVQTAAAAGATELKLTLGATAAAANLYQDGFVLISDVDGVGYSYKILKHAAVLSGGVITLTLAEPLQVAVTTNSKADLLQNPYKGVIQLPATTLTGTPVGACVYIIKAGEYGWICTRGPVGVSVEGTSAVGTQMAVPSDTAGQCVVQSAGLAQIGFMCSVGIDEKVKHVFLQLD